MRSLFASSLSCNSVQFRRTRLSAAIGAAFAAAAAFWVPQAQADDLNCMGTPCTVQDGEHYDNVYGSRTAGVSGDVTITGGTVGTEGNGGNVWGQDGVDDATGNKVTIRGGQIGGDVWGGTII